ncbi:PAS domain-containing sensor histidine kinase, partial [Myxosarcina sp. GI1]|uniref:PAS domain-containing sensor histidine kinase n=1 Tax=Myxosarcina sp. GI1 TaxID=1541065 RepID=UPI0012E09F95
MMNLISLLQNKKSTPNLANKLRFASVTLPILVIFIGLIVIVGWSFDLPNLKSVLSGRVTMKVSTALGFIISSISILLWHWQQTNPSHQTKNNKNSSVSVYLYLLPCLLIVFTLLTLFEYGFQVDLNTDWLSFPENSNAVDAVVRGRMSPNTALCFFWINGAILLLINRYYLALQLLAVTVIAIALTSIVGHVYDLSWFYGLNSGTGMAIHTAISFMLLGVALLATHADKKLMRVITIDEAGGLMARWLLPLVTAVPLFFGWFFWSKFIENNIAFETRIALRTIVEIIILDGIVLWTANKLNQIDRQRHKLDRELKENEQQLRLAFDRAVIGKALASIDGRFIKVNPAFCKLLGYNESELLQLSIQDITYLEDFSINSNYNQELLANKLDSYQIEKRYVHKSGRIVWVSLGVSLVRDEINRPKYFVGQMQDITERVQAETEIVQLNEELEARVKQRTSELETANQSLKLEIVERQKTEDALRSSMATNRALLNAIPDWMFRLNNAGTLINFQAPRNTRIPSFYKKITGKKLDEVLPKEVATVLMNGIKTALGSNKVQVCEYQLKRKTKIKDYEARIAVSGCQEVMAIVRDITQRKQVEKNILTSLEREKKLNELKTRFVTTTSHEFRTPLASILSSSELLEHYGHKWTDNKKLNHLHRIQTSVKHMTGLLNDVLLLGKADAGKLVLNPAKFDLHQFCQELIEEIALISPTHQIIFSQDGCLSNEKQLAVDNEVSVPAAETSAFVCMDEKLLRHILTNLLSNAIKYSPDSDKVYLDVTCETKRTVFCIRDTGIGIPAEEQECLFDSFHR